MIDPEVLMRKAVADALDETGLSPACDDSDVGAFLSALIQHGYVVTRIPEPQEE